jgi:3-hydroxy-9,10-secoandrosta-1,3,5(10)-triene-9,17-dione monooxygenase reductase component
MIDPEAEVWTLMQASGRFTVNVLQWSDRNLADVFAGLAPAPGGNFTTATWLDTAHGPALDQRTWAGCRLVESRAVGYSLLVTAEIEDVSIDPSEPTPGQPEESPALARLRGRYTPVPPPRR